MSKTKVIILSVLITLFLAPYASAQTESFSLAKATVKMFDKETRANLPDTLDKEKKSLFTKELKKNKHTITVKIKSLRRSEGPSPRRFQRLYRIIERYTKEYIKGVDEFGSTLKGAEKTEIEKLSIELKTMRKEYLDELRASSYSERKPGERYKPDPVLDRSPYEQRPGDTRGLYNR